MNIYDIAQKAGVSIATVSRVINGKKNVSPKTEQKVLEVIEELGYTPNIFARGLGLDTIKMIGVVCSTVDDIYYAKAVSILETELRKHGYDVLLYCTGMELGNKQKAVQVLLEKKVDAFVFVGSVYNEPKDNTYIKKAADQVPVFLINNYVDYPNVYSVLCDDEEAMTLAVDELVKKGHSKILYLYESNTFSARAKLEGVTQALEANHLANDSAYMLKIERDIMAAHRCVKDQIEKGVSFSAILASDDLLAVGALQAVLAEGMKVPQDVAVVGFNNSMLSMCTVPNLTTIDSKVENICSFAADSLIKCLGGQSVTKKLVVSSELVIRQTL